MNTPRVDALMDKWGDDGATRGAAFIELRDLARELESELAVEPIVRAWEYETPMPDGSIFRGASCERLTIGVGVPPDSTEYALGRIVPVAATVGTNEMRKALQDCVSILERMDKIRHLSPDFPELDNARRILSKPAPAVQQGGEASESYCLSCRGEGCFHTGIDEAPVRQCKACNGSGVAQPAAAHPVMDDKSAFVAAYMKYLRENTHDGRQWLNDERDANDAWNKIPGIMWRAATSIKAME